MTSEQAIKRLTPAQRRLFEKLHKPRPKGEAGVYLTRIERRSAAVLERLGWVSSSGDGVWNSYSLTPLGMLIAGPIFVVTT